MHSIEPTAMTSHHNLFLTLSRISDKMTTVEEIACAAICIATFLVVFFSCQAVIELKPRVLSLNITVTLKTAREQRRRRRQTGHVNENVHRPQRRPQENDEYGGLFNGQNYGRLKIYIYIFYFPLASFYKIKSTNVNSGLQRESTSENIAGQL